METDAILPAAGAVALGGHVFWDADCTVRHCVCSGKSRQQDDVLSDFQRGCFAVDWERVLWQRKIKMSPEVLAHRFGDWIIIQLQNNRNRREMQWKTGQARCRSTVWTASLC